MLISQWKSKWSHKPSSALIKHHQTLNALSWVLSLKSTLTYIICSARTIVIWILFYRLIPYKYFNTSDKLLISISAFSLSSVIFHKLPNPCFTHIVFIPNCFAGTISLSIRSPIMTAFSGLQLLLSNAISNMRLSGFETPSSADAIIKSRYFRTPRFSNLSEVPND